MTQEDRADMAGLFLGWTRSPTHYVQWSLDGEVGFEHTELPDFREPDWTGYLLHSAIETHELRVGLLAGNFCSLLYSGKFGVMKTFEASGNTVTQAIFGACWKFCSEHLRVRADYLRNKETTN